MLVSIPGNKTKDLAIKLAKLGGKKELYFICEN